MSHLASITIMKPVTINILDNIPAVVRMISRANSTNGCERTNNVIVIYYQIHKHKIINVPPPPPQLFPYGSGRKVYNTPYNERLT